MGEAERIRYLKRHIQDLDEGEKELLRLRYVAGLSFAEMARLLGRSQGAVKKSLYRLLARCKARWRTTVDKPYEGSMEFEAQVRAALDVPGASDDFVAALRGGC